ncbi:hypothetical protein VKS41_006192 [Umbelopsis sp. WA50703]
MPQKSDGATSDKKIKPAASIISYGGDIVVGALLTLKPILSLLLAAAILATIVSYAYNTITGTVVDLVCPSIWGSYIPLCQDFRAPVPDFSQLVEKQVNLYETMTTQYNPDSISAIELKRVELATRDLQVMIKYSKLGSAHLLDEKLGDYLLRSRDLGRNIQSLQAKTKGTIDNLITYNSFLLRKLSEVEMKKGSKQELRKLYETSMGLVEDESARLILAIETAQGCLDRLEEDLYSIQEITAQETYYQDQERPSLLADILNMITGKGMRRPLVEKNLALLNNFETQRRDAAQKLKLMLHRMIAFQSDLEELRSQVVKPIIIADSLPLELHIENVGKGIARLRESKVLESRPEVQPLLVGKD